MAIWDYENCASCGTSLHPVSLLNSVYVTDLEAEGTTVQLRFCRANGCAKKLLAPATVKAYQKTTGLLPPARSGDDPMKDTAL